MCNLFYLWFLVIILRVGDIHGVTGFKKGGEVCYGSLVIHSNIPASARIGASGNNRNRRILFKLFGGRFLPFYSSISLIK